MKRLAIGIFLLASSAPAWAGDEWDFLPEPQARGAAVKGGPRVWAKTEVYAGLLEATDASGDAATRDSESDFNSDIDTWVQQAIISLNAGYELDFGLTIYGKLGYALPTLNQDIDAASLVVGATDERQGGAADMVLVYGVGVGLRREIGSKVFILGGLEYLVGAGEFNQVEMQSVRGDGDYDYTRLLVRGAVGFSTDLALLYIGVRYTMTEIEIDFQADPGTAQFDVTYELDTPVGVFLGASSKIGEKLLWSVELGFVDGLSFDVGVGFAF